MIKRLLNAFSLFELLTAVVIIAVLAAVGGPVYKSYSVKSKFAEVFSDMTKYKDQMADEYLTNDLFPSDLAGMTADTYTTVTSDVLQLVYYQVSTDSQAAYLHLYTDDLGVDDFEAVANDGSGGVHCRVSLVAVVNSGQIEFYCGQWDGTNVSVPLSYLPNTCQGTNLSGLIS